MKRAERAELAARKARRAEGDLSSALHKLGLEWEVVGGVQRAHMRVATVRTIPTPLPDDVAWEAHVILLPEESEPVPPLGPLLAWLAQGLRYLASAEGRPLERVLGDELCACAGVARAGAWLLLVGWLVALHMR